ncbi:MAG: HEAT repeat domain-containing protein [Gammaproteobacteria bacterium]|nr:HEAT repeat domain-containing protein [Gammaproteobacteria bacterium]
MGIKEKRRIGRLLQSPDLDAIIAELLKLPPSVVINPLIGALCSTNETARWHAIGALGPVIAQLADRDMEAARVVMRRFMWSLNDESGGIGWGAPEAMAEIMVCHDGLADEYAHMLVAYMREDGFHLELEQLQRGLMWGLGRLAQDKPDLLNSKDAVRYLLPYLDSFDTMVRGLAARTLGLLHAKESTPLLEKLVDDPAPLRFYTDRRFHDGTVGELAYKALANIAKES